MAWNYLTCWSFWNQQTARLNQPLCGCIWSS